MPGRGRLVVRRLEDRMIELVPDRHTEQLAGDLAAAMKMNPNLKIMANAGYFDVVTPFYEGIYEMSHLPIPMALQANITFAYYESGHMVYVNEASLKALHENVAAFIRKNSGSNP